jgi:hypothetical protein
MTFSVLIPQQVDADRVVRLTERAEGTWTVVWIDRDGQYQKGTCSGPVGRALQTWHRAVADAARLDRSSDHVDDDARRACEGMDG